MAKKKRKKPVVGTRRTREHVIGDLAINHVERQALLANFTAERTRNDYGIDVMVFTYDAGGEPTDGYIPVQVKATESLSWLRRKKAAAYRIERRHLVTWLRQSLPVILTVYDAAADRAYWIHVQGYFAALPGFNVFRAEETITVHLPESQLLDPDAMRRFDVLREQSRLLAPRS